MAPPTRLQLARRRLRLARYSIGAASLTAFAAFGFAVRDAHPATHTATHVASTATFSAAATRNTTVISPAPQAAAPQVQSSGS
jgi:hypothetical protein